jgi:hypothetical protein
MSVTAVSSAIAIHTIPAKLAILDIQIYEDGVFLSIVTSE